MNKLTTNEAEQLASLCRLSYVDFIKEFWEFAVPEKLCWNWHLTYLARQAQAAVERILEGKPAQDVIVNVSPGTSKSTIWSVLLPAYCLARLPSFRFIGASYTDALAMDLSRKSRNVVRSDKYQACFPYVKVEDDQDTKGYWATSKGGMRFAVGSGGSVTGMHGHMIVIDDPLDPSAAASELELASTNTWVRETLSSRKVDKVSSTTILVMQRLHQGDPTEEMSQRENVTHIVLPATSDFPIKPEKLEKYYVDGLMDPVRLPESVLRKTRKEIGEYGYAGQYGQTPIPMGGGMFNTERVRIISNWNPHLTDFYQKDLEYQEPTNFHVGRDGKITEGIPQQDHMDPTSTPDVRGDNNKVLGGRFGGDNDSKVIRFPGSTQHNYGYRGKIRIITCRFWDKAATAVKAGKKGSRAAFSVGAKLHLLLPSQELILSDIIRVRVNSAEREQLILETAHRDGKEVIVGVEQEGGGGGKESAENTVKMLQGFRVRIIIPKGDKELRADPFSVQVNNGALSIVLAEWNKAFLEEMAYFPNSTFKDQIDACSGAYTILSQGNNRVGGMKAKK